MITRVILLALLAVPLGAAVNIPFTTLYQGMIEPANLRELNDDNAAFLAPHYTVLSNHDELDAFFAAIDEPAPEVNFPSEMALAAVSGMRRSDCGFRIQSVDRVGGIFVDVFGALDGTGNWICYHVINNKAHVVAVPHSVAATFKDARTNAVVGFDAAT